MYLLKTWGESLLLFKPSNFKLLFLVTLNNLRRHYKFFLYFILLFLACDNNLWKIIFGTKFFWLNYLQILLFLYMPFIFVLVLRPSVKRKSCEYFCDHKWHVLFWLFIPIVNIIFSRYATVFTANFLLIFLGIFQNAAIFLFEFPIFVLPALMIENFFALFWLDSRPNFKQIFLSLWRAIKMFVFNLPVYFILCAIPYLCFIFFFSSYYWLFGRFWEVVLVYTVLLAYIFYTCFLVNFYTKNIHDKFSVYFRE